MAERRLRLTVEYDGTDFAGYQSQGKGERTVQDELQGAVSKILGRKAVVIAAGRTDAGVHARGQVVHVDVGGRLDVATWIAALNANLPSDLAVRAGMESDPGFHARFSATSRTYRYVVLNEGYRSPTMRRYSLLRPGVIDLDAMRDAGGVLTGTMDFASLANAGGNPGSTTVRSLQRLRVRRVGSMIVIEVRANAFLRSMVRNIIGMLLAVGEGALPVERVLDIIEARDRTQNPCKTVPAHGLWLWSVEYGPKLGPKNEDF